MRLPKWGIIISLDGLSSKYRFIKIYDSMTSGFEVLNFGLDFLPPILILDIFVRIDYFYLLYLLAFDLMLLIYLSK